MRTVGVSVFTGVAALEAAVGAHLGHSDWLVIEQDRIDAFAHATGDHQWIHTDPDRAAAGPFGATVAHGFLTLSLIPLLCEQIYRVDGVAMALNYGSDRVRYLTPVLAGSAVRAGAELTSAARVDRGVRAVVRLVVERQADAQPVCVADLITLYVP